MTDSPQVRVLLVEDEEQIRNMTSRMLKNEGFQVTTRTDGEEGWEALQEGNYTFVLTDVVMPRLGGWELFERAREAGEVVPFLFMSGYTHGVGDGEGSEDWVFLQKPFTSKDLIKTIHTLID